MSSWAIGALLSLFGAAAGNLGVNTQKHSLTREGRKPLAARRPVWRQKEYWLGLAFIVFGSLGDFAALSMVAQSAIAPLSSISLVINIAFAHFWLGEYVGRRELIGTALIMTGATLSVVFGDHSDKKYTHDQLIDLIAGGLFIAYVVVTLVLIGVGVAIHLRVTPLKRRLVDLEATQLMEDFHSGRIGADGHYTADSADATGQPHEARTNGASAHEAAAPNKVDQSELSALRQQFAPWSRYHAFILCGLSGVLGAQSILFSKCFSVLFATTVGGDNQLNQFFPWVCAVGMLVSIFSQLYFMAQALASYDSLYCVPVFQCFFIMFSAMGGAAYFREVQNFTWTQTIMFPVGFAITLVGVAILTVRTRAGKEDALVRQRAKIIEETRAAADGGEDGMLGPLQDGLSAIDQGHRTRLLSASPPHSDALSDHRVPVGPSTGGSTPIASPSQARAGV